MPRYYFHTYESRRTIIDDEGCDICDDTAARSEAIATVAEMAREASMAERANRVMLDLRRGQHPVAIVAVTMVVDEFERHRNEKTSATIVFCGNGMTIVPAEAESCDLPAPCAVALAGPRPCAVRTRGPAWARHSRIRCHLGERGR